jgi:hypothetical protein
LVRRRRVANTGFQLTELIRPTSTVVCANGRVAYRSEGWGSVSAFALVVNIYASTMSHAFVAVSLSIAPADWREHEGARLRLLFTDATFVRRRRTANTGVQLTEFLRPASAGVCAFVEVVYSTIVRSERTFALVINIHSPRVSRAFIAVSVSVATTHRKPKFHAHFRLRLTDAALVGRRRSANARIQLTELIGPAGT